MSTELAANPNYKALVQLVDKQQSRLLEALPRNIDGVATIRRTLMAVRNNPSLLRCDPASLFFAVAEATSAGLQIGGIGSHCYLVPYGLKCQLIIGYKGMIELVRRTGNLASVTMQLVRECDEFEYVEGDSPILRHVPSTQPDAESNTITHVYVIFRMRDGAVVRNVWTSARVNDHRDRYSQGYRRAEVYREQCESTGEVPDEAKLSPWHTAWRQQAHKTLVRDLFSRGLLEFSLDAQSAVMSDAAAETGKTPQAVSQEFAQSRAALAALFADTTPPSDSSEVVVSRLGHSPEPVVDAPQQIAATEPIDIEAPNGDWDIETLKADLAKAKNLGQVTAIREAHLVLCDNPVDADAVRSVCSERESELRAAKGAK